MDTQPCMYVDNLGFFSVITLEMVLEYQAYDTFTVVSHTGYCICLDVIIYGSENALWIWGLESPRMNRVIRHGSKEGCWSLSPELTLSGTAL